MAHDRYRRSFIGRVSFTLGGVALGGLLPVSLLQAAPAACLVDAAAWPDACGDWQLDDVCLAYPPYALHMQAAVTQVVPMSAMIDPVDRHWVG